MLARWPSSARAKWTAYSSTYTRTARLGPCIIGDLPEQGILVPHSGNDSATTSEKNEAGTKSHWLGVNLIGTKANRDAVGAMVTYPAGDMKRTRTKVAGGSYLSYHDPRLVLGIGQRPKVDWIEIKWPPPSGAVERFTGLPIDRYITIVEGQGKWK